MFYALLVIIILIVLIVVISKARKNKTAPAPDNTVNVNLSDILIFDTETTGIFPKSEEILELAIVNGCGDILFNERFKPAHKKS